MSDNLSIGTEVVVSYLGGARLGKISSKPMQLKSAFGGEYLSYLVKLEGSDKETPVRNHISTKIER